MKYCILWHNRKQPGLEPAFVGRNGQLNLNGSMEFIKSDIKFFNSYQDATSHTHRDHQDVITEDEADLILVELKLRKI
jgi:hypothetical protein